MTKFLIALLFAGMLALAPVKTRSHSNEPETGSGLYIYAQEEGGNPEHKEPSKKCSHKADGLSKIACSCHQDCGKENDVKCKSYCFKQWCDCAKEDCD